MKNTVYKLGVGDGYWGLLYLISQKRIQGYFTKNINIKINIILISSNQVGASQALGKLHHSPYLDYGEVLLLRLFRVLFIISTLLS